MILAPENIGRGGLKPPSPISATRVADNCSSFVLRNNSRSANLPVHRHPVIQTPVTAFVWKVLIKRAQITLASSPKSSLRHIYPKFPHSPFTMIHRAQQHPFVCLDLKIKIDAICSSHPPSPFLAPVQTPGFLSKITCFPFTSICLNIIEPRFEPRTMHATSFFPLRSTAGRSGGVLILSGILPGMPTPSISRCLLSQKNRAGHLNRPVCLLHLLHVVPDRLAHELSQFRVHLVEVGFEARVMCCSPPPEPAIDRGSASRSNPCASRQRSTMACTSGESAPLGMAAIMSW